LGYCVTGTTNPVDALESFQQDPHGFDLIITDQTMPQMTGDVFIRHVRAVRPDIPIILCTGFSENMDEKRAHQMGVKQFLLKPISLVDLSKAVRAVFEELKK